jgi:hypothetical protein
MKRIKRLKIIDWLLLTAIILLGVSAVIIFVNSRHKAEKLTGPQAKFAL